jgi:hypothetical protein
MQSPKAGISIMGPVINRRFYYILAIGPITGLSKPLTCHSPFALVKIEYPPLAPGGRTGMHRTPFPISQFFCCLRELFKHFLLFLSRTNTHFKL